MTFLLQACAVAVVHLGTHLQEHSIVLRQSYGCLAKLSDQCNVDGPYGIVGRLPVSKTLAASAFWDLIQSMSSKGTGSKSV